MKNRCRDSESSVDDLRTGRGVVLGRAVATLRSVETHPFAWRIRLVGKDEAPFFFIFFWRVVVFGGERGDFKFFFLARGSRRNSEIFKVPPRVVVRGALGTRRFFRRVL